MITTPTTCCESPLYDFNSNNKTSTTALKEKYVLKLTDFFNKIPENLFFPRNVSFTNIRRSLFNKNCFKQTKELTNIVIEAFSSDEDSIIFEDEICFEKDISLLEAVSKLYDPKLYCTIVFKILILGFKQKR